MFIMVFIDSSQLQIRTDLLVHHFLKKELPTQDQEEILRPLEILLQKPTNIQSLYSSLSALRSQL